MIIVSPDNASFTCVANGVPQPAITWLNDSMVLEIPPMVPDTLMVTEMIMDERTTKSILQLLMVQPIYASSYTCRASNDLGIDEVTANLVVHGKYKFTMFIVVL